MTETTAPRTHRWRGRAVRAVAGVALVAVGVGGGIWWQSRAAAAPAVAATRTTLVAATLGTVKQTVSSTGTIQPATQSTQTFGSSGTVTAVDVAVGDAVKKGERLATIDPTALQNAVDLAQAGVTAAQDQVSSATSGTSAAASAQAQLASAQQQLASARTALTGATLTSPIAGVVSSVGLTVGAASGGSSSGSSSGSGSGGSSSGAGSGSGAGSSTSSGITVIDTTTWLVDATVRSSDLTRLKKGLQATVTVSGAAQPVFGTVASVGVVASSTSSGTAEFPVVIAVTGHPTGLHAGTSAEVAITTRQLTDVLTVPTLAVSTTGGQTTVAVSKDGKTSTVPVTVGGVYGASTQITKGLAEGDMVVVRTRSFAGTGTGTGTTGRNGTGGFGQGGLGGGLGGGFNGGGPPAGGAPAGGS